MGKNKKKEDEFNYDQKKNISKNLYNVILKEKTGSTTATYSRFTAVRWFEEDSEIAYLKNNKNGFLQVMPEQENFDLTTLDKSKLITEKELIEADLNEIESMTDTAEIIETYGNPKNLQWKLAIVNAKLHALKYKPRVYGEFAENGEKEFVFLRVGSHYIPKSIDVETFTEFYPSDSKKMNFAFTHRNKQQKHGMGTKLMSAALMGAWVFGLVFLGASAYILKQNLSSYSESEVIKARNNVLETSSLILDNNARQSKEITQIYETVAEKLIEPTIVVEGIVPK